MKKLFGMSLILMTVGLLFSAQNVNTAKPLESKYFTMGAQSASSISLRFNRAECEMTEISVGGKTTQLLVGDNTSMIEGEGLPVLPYYTSMVAVPPRGGIALEINGYDEDIQTGVLIPAAVGVDISGNQTRNASLAFKTDEIYPQTIAEISQPQVLRDERFVILTVYPYAYNPATRELITRSNIEVNIVTENTQGVNEINTDRKRSRSFETLYNSLFLNPTGRDEAECQARSILIVYPDISAVEDVVFTMGNWKRRKGFEVAYLNIGDLSYSTNSHIKSYIQDAYDSWENPPEYIIIVGDANGSLSVPTWTENYSGYQGCGDNPYTLLDGGDLIPDAFIGRLSISTADNLFTIWSKIVNYEIMPYTSDTAWYGHSALISDTGSSGMSTYYTNQFTKESILWYDQDHTFTEVTQVSPSPTLLSNAFNEGSLVFSYRGIGELNGWDVDDINNLSNGKKLCNTTIITCNTGTFDSSQLSRSEALLRLGSSAAPRGAIGAIGMATNGTHTPFNNCLHGGIYYGLYMQGMNTMGEALVRGKLNLHKSYSSSFQTFVNSFSHWCNLMGDPSLEVWKTMPKSFTVNFEESLPTGSNSIHVQVIDGGGNGVEDAWVTINQLNDDNEELLFATGYTGPDGTIRLYFPNDTEGNVNLTVTKPQHVPTLETFTVGGSSMIGFHDVAIDDDNNGDSHGNGNSAANAGETIELVPVLKNFNNNQALSVSATLGTDDPYVTIIDSTEDYSDIEGGGVSTCNDDFEIEISLDCPDRHVITFTLEVSSTLGTWRCCFDVPVLGSDLDVNGFDISGNGVLDPGESANLVVTMVNSGNVTLNNVQATLESLGSYASVIDANAVFGDVAPGGETSCVSNQFTVSASSIAVPGMTCKFRVNLFNEDGYSESEILTLPIGMKTSTDPAGPDAYGYFCFDSGDTNYDEVPQYEWIGITPSENGSGTNTGIYDPGENYDDIGDVELPFIFNFYGEQYNHIWISSNGWISFLETNMSTFRNWHLPGPLGPRAMIAAFWDDLITSGGGIYTWYNSDENYFVIEWYMMRNHYGNYNETFEIILYDPEHYQTSTGDGMIKIQYDDFNNVDQGSSSPYYPQHGNYCTIGLENHNSDDGIEYTFNNIYTAGAQTLSDHSAILFTPIFAGSQDVFLRINNVDIIGSDEDGTVRYGSYSQFNIGLENTGFEMANNVTASISTNNPHAQIIQATSDYPGIASGESQVNENPFILYVDPFCPNEEQVAIELQVVCGENVFERNFGFICKAPELGVSQMLLVDETNDGMLEPGESASLRVTLENSGAYTANGINVVLECENEYIQFSNTAIVLESLQPGNSMQLASDFNFTVSSDCPAINHFRVVLTTSEQVGHYDVYQHDFNVGFFDNLELGQGDWIYYTIDGSYEMWNMNDSRSFSPETSWKCGGPGPNNYYNDILCALESPEITITDNSCLTFVYWMEAEISTSYPGYCYDGGCLQANVDGQWEQITPVGGYPYLSRGPSSQFEYETPLFSGEVDWERVFFDLSDFGETIKFRFVFGSDTGTVFEGWYIDDIAITESDAFLLPPRNLVATYMGGQNVVLEWTASESEGDSYGIYRRSNLSEPFSLISTTTAVGFTDDSAAPGVYQYYAVTRISGDGESPYSDPVQVYTGASGQAEVDAPEYKTELGQNFPNPFNPETIIPFSLKKPSFVTIDIYNVRGQRVKRLVQGDYSEGQHQIVWNSLNEAGKPVSSGIYFSKMNAGGVQNIRKMLLLK